MSRPDTRSALSEDASASASKQSAGRRLANRPSSLRRRSKPCSGLRWKGLLSHLGPPTAPNITASLAFALAMTASGIAVPSASSAAPPTMPSSRSNVTARSLPNQSATRTTWSITSGPMPSPGRIRRDLLLLMVAIRGENLSGKPIAPAGRREFVVPGTTVRGQPIAPAGRDFKARMAPANRVGNSKEVWSGRRDLNSRPSRWQRDALPLSYSRADCSGNRPNHRGLP